MRLWLLVLLVAAAALVAESQTGSGRRSSRARSTGRRAASSRRASRRQAPQRDAGTDDAENEKDLRRYCARYKNRMRRSGKAREYTEEKCYDRLRRFCRKRCRKGRSLTKKCEALDSRRPRWRERCETEDESAEGDSRSSRGGRGSRGSRGRSGQPQTSQEETLQRWSNKKAFKQTWKEVRAKKASPEAIKRYKTLGRQVVFRDQLNADRTYASITPRTLPKPKDPRRRDEPNELTINDPSEHFEGDMDKTPAQLEADEEELLDRLRVNRGRRRKRKVAKKGVYAHWPAGKPISYHFADSFASATKPLVREAIKFWEEQTCVRFQENGPETNRLEFSNGGGCSSYVGMVGGTQEVSIRTPGCDKFGIVCHEIGHALGFFHEQARPDRDQKVQVMLNNVNFWYQNNFAKMDEADVEPAAEAQSYDYGSVMHYDAFSFATNPAMPTIRPRQGAEAYQETMGQRREPSFIDVAQVNAVYCATKCSAAQARQCQNGGYPNPNDCGTCHCPNGLGGRFCDIPASSTACPGAGLLSAYNDRNKQTIETPNFGRGSFSSTAECVWLIQARPGYKVFFEAVENFELDCKQVCDDNYMEVKAAADFRPTGPRYCCDYMPFDDVQTSESHKLLIIMKNRNRQSKAGFKIRYWTDDRAAVPSGGPITPAPTTRTTPRITTTTTRDPDAFTGAGPGPGDGCTCGSWSQFSSCSEDCGGCGRVERSRTCTPASRKCYRVEQRICNRSPCPSGSKLFGDFNIGFRGAKLTIDGCCGSLQDDGFCGPLNLRRILRTFVGGSRTTSSAGSGGDLLGGLLGGSGSNPLSTFTNFFGNRGKK